MPKLRDQMAMALASAAAAAVEQGRTSELRPVPAADPEPAEPPVSAAVQLAEPAAPVAQMVAVPEPMPAPPTVVPTTAPGAEVLEALERPRAAQPGDLVQFGFRCPRDLKREVERFCFERDVTMQEFGQAALRLLLDELQRRSPAG